MRCHRAWFSKGSCSNCHACSTAPASSANAAMSSSSFPITPVNWWAHHFWLQLDLPTLICSNCVQPSQPFEDPKPLHHPKKSHLHATSSTLQSFHRQKKSQPGSAEVAEGCRLFTSGSMISSYSSKPGAISFQGRALIQEISRRQSREEEFLHRKNMAWHVHSALNIGNGPSWWNSRLNIQAKDSEVEGVISLVILTQNLPIQIHAGCSSQPTESSLSQKSPTETKWLSFIRPPYFRMRVSKYLMEASCPIIGVILLLSFGGWEIDLFCDSQSLPILRTDISLISLVQRTRHPATIEVFFCQQPLQHASAVDHLAVLGGCRLPL